MTLGFSVAGGQGRLGARFTPRNDENSVAFKRNIITRFCSNDMPLLLGDGASEWRSMEEITMALWDAHIANTAPPMVPLIKMRHGINPDPFLLRSDCVDTNPSLREPQFYDDRQRRQVDQINDEYCIRRAKSVHGKDGVALRLISDPGSDTVRARILMWAQND